MKKIIGILFVACALLVAAACVEEDQGTIPPDDREVTWWFAGDSMFAGDWNYSAAPRFLEDVRNVAVPGSTLIRVQNHPTIEDQLAPHGPNPDTHNAIVFHAGGADMYARELYQLEHTIEDYMAVVDYFDTGFREMGLDVYWTSIAPTNDLVSEDIRVAQNQNEMRLALNAAIAAKVGSRFVNCEPALVSGPGSVWGAPELYINDGVHLNEAGAEIHAHCIANAIPGLKVKSN